MENTARVFDLSNTMDMFENEEQVLQTEHCYDIAMRSIRAVAPDAKEEEFGDILFHNIAEVVIKDGYEAAKQLSENHWTNMVLDDPADDRISLILTKPQAEMLKVCLTDTLNHGGEVGKKWARMFIDALNKEGGK